MSNRVKTHRSALAAYMTPFVTDITLDWSVISGHCLSTDGAWPPHWPGIQGYVPDSNILYVDESF